MESSQIGCLTVEVCFGCCLPLLSIETPRKKLLTKGAERFMGLKLCESKNSGILQAKQQSSKIPLFPCAKQKVLRIKSGSLNEKRQIYELFKLSVPPHKRDPLPAKLASCIKFQRREGTQLHINRRSLKTKMKSCHSFHSFKGVPFHLRAINLKYCVFVNIWLEFCLNFVKL